MKLNKIMPFISIPLLLVGCSNQDLAFVDNPTAEYMSENTDACDFIISYKGKEISQSERGTRVINTNGTRISCSEIDTSTIGRNKVYYDVDGKMASLIVDVKDTTPPKITFIDNVHSNNPLDYVKATDSSGILSLDYIGSFDPNKAGDYSLKIIATDNEGNKAEKEIIITVEQNALNSEETEIAQDVSNQENVEEQKQ